MRLLFKRGFYSRGAYNSENTVSITEEIDPSCNNISSDVEAIGKNLTIDQLVGIYIKICECPWVCPNTPNSLIFQPIFVLNISMDSLCHGGIEKKYWGVIKAEIFFFNSVTIFHTHQKVSFRTPCLFVHPNVRTPTSPSFLARFR